MIRTCVIGFPVKHSRSPLIHGYWLKTLGIAGKYERIEVPPRDLQEFLGNLQRNGFAGCNITLPHKEMAARLIANLDSTARQIGSINTVFTANGELHAMSTDGYGFVANLAWRQPGLDLKNTRVVIIGAGGSAKAIADGLLTAGVPAITITNRTIGRANDLVDALGTRLKALPLAKLSQALGSADLLINTTSAGIANEGDLDIDLGKLPKHAVVADINYVPLNTPLLAKAQHFGLQTVDGLGMLLHQAVPGFEKWFGHRPTVTDDLYQLVARDIDPGYQP